MRTMGTLGDEHRHVSAERNRITATANGRPHKPPYLVHRRRDRTEKLMTGISARQSGQPLQIA